MLIISDKAIAVTRLQKPSEFSIWPGPKHKITGNLNACFGRTPECIAPLGTGTDHKLNFVGQRERFLEENVGVERAASTGFGTLGLAA
jgi:hypothetical protein